MDFLPASLGMIGLLIRLLVPFIGVLVAIVATVYALKSVRRQATGSTAGWADQLTDAITAGSLPPQERAVLTGGAVAEATILDRMEWKRVAKSRVMVYATYDFVLEVRLQGWPPYRVPCRQEFITSESFHVTQGTIVPVRIDTTNPQIVYIDREALKQRALDTETAEREAHARRQAELLRRSS